jgi:hypothetical protein
MYRLTLLVAFLVLFFSSSASAQTSASYRLQEHTVNAGGRPLAGIVASSASFRISLDAIGDSVGGTQLNGASYRMEPGFGPAYSPPGQVTGLRFTDSTELVWEPERSAGEYNLYRGLISIISGLTYGDCEQPGLTGETTIDTDLPPASDGYFYLVTAENRLGEEGSKGRDSDGVERPNPAPCP